MRKDANEKTRDFNDNNAQKIGVITISTYFLGVHPVLYIPVVTCYFDTGCTIIFPSSYSPILKLNK